MWYAWTGWTFVELGVWLAVSGIFAMAASLLTGWLTGRNRRRAFLATSLVPVALFLVYRPGCGCVGIYQVIGTAEIAGIVCAAVFMPALAFFLWRGRRR